MIRPHPALKVQQEAAHDLLRILSEFGGTPSSRSRLKVAPAEKEVDPLAEFLSH
jgi:P27 family predicted phage terminase small subunit